MNAKSFYCKPKLINLELFLFPLSSHLGSDLDEKHASLYSGREIPVQRHCTVRGGDAFCWPPWKPTLLLFHPHLLLTASFSCWASCPGGSSPRDLWRAGGGGQGMEEDGRCVCTMRVGGTCLQPKRDLRRGSALCPDRWCWSLTISMAFSGPDKAGGLATEPDHLLLGTVCSPSVFSQGLGGFWLEVFLAVQGSDCQSLRVNSSWCHCWLRRTKTTASRARP